MKTYALVAMLATCAVGCTFLVSFDDVPDAGQAEPQAFDAGKRSSSSSSSGSESSTSSSGEVVTPQDSGTAETFPPACDGNITLADIGCGTYTRSECNTEPGVTGAALQDGDLIDCNAQQEPTCVRHCPHGCAEMPKGFPDQCDDCFGKPDGTYCAKDFRNWDSKNDVFAIECKDGKKVDATDCTALTIPKGCATKCTVGTTSPACCQ